MSSFLSPHNRSLEVTIARQMPSMARQIDHAGEKRRERVFFSVLSGPGIPIATIRKGTISGKVLLLTDPRHAGDISIFFGMRRIVRKCSGQ